MTVSVSKFKEHSAENYEAWKEIWTEYSKEFVEATDVKYYWGFQEQEDGVYYFSINMFPSVEKREAWGATYDLEEGQKEFNSCLLYTSPSPRDDELSRMPSSA